VIHDGMSGTGKRIVFWDDSDIGRDHLMRVSIVEHIAPTTTAGMLLKVGSFCNFVAGWVYGTCGLELSQTKYLVAPGILAALEYFVAKLDGLSTVPFTNVLDKGYCCFVAAWQKGQYVLQPFFAKSDQQFSTEQLMPSAEIATDRGGNEDAVNVCKRSGLLQRGRLEGAVGRLINLTMLG